MAAAPVADDRAAPYLGLAPYDTDDADRFFGRRTMTARLVDLLDRHRFVAVFGVSGSGKSSLLRAGLVPAVDNGGGRAAVVVTPGPRSVALDGVLARECVLVVDRFEELLTLCAVIGVRTDFYARCIELLGLASLLADATVPVAAMTEDDVRGRWSRS